MAKELCPADFDNCKEKKCCLFDGEANETVITHCSDPCYCYNYSGDSKLKCAYDKDKGCICGAGGEIAYFLVIVDSDGPYYEEHPNMIDKHWKTFRSYFPDNPVCVLQVEFSGLTLPSGFDGIYARVPRDISLVPCNRWSAGNNWNPAEALPASDWFKIFDCSNASRVNWSGHKYKLDPKIYDGDQCIMNCMQSHDYECPWAGSSFHLFYQKCNEAGVPVYQNGGGSISWIYNMYWSLGLAT